ncbi:MAG: lytic transglycosylase domain-containing protein [Nitrospirae bacterium]|nr:lytic transglycosylase domain-containing protein [Nitrospirota bacterium]
MRKDNTKGCIGAVSRKVSMITLVATCLIVIPGFALVFAARDLGKSASEADVAYAAEINPVILKWMKDNSGMSEEVLSEIYRTAASNTNSDLILAICMVESNFNPKVKSNKGALGLMGILPRAWLDELKAQGIIRGKDDLYQISANIASGSYVLQKYLAKNKTFERALIDYVGGDPGYVRKVMNALGGLYRAKWSKPENV